MKSAAPDDIFARPFPSCRLPATFLHMPQRKHGILFACLALLFWSTSSSSVVLAAQTIGPWQLLGLATLIAAVFQFAAYLLIPSLKMPLKKLLFLPPKLFVLMLLTFVLYALVYTLALVLAEPPQKVGVNLCNFLWPSLTILFGTFLVPGHRLTPKLVVALVLALSGVVLANFDGLRGLLVSTAASAASPPAFRWLPYIFGLMAGISWAVYSAMLARWKSWASEYSTSAVGFLLTAIISLTICFATDSWRPLDLPTALNLLYMGLAVEGAAYLFWELALHRTSPQTLGLLASVNAVLSTLWLITIYPLIGRRDDPPNYLHTLIAAGLITAAIILGRNADRNEAPSEPVSGG